MVLLQCYKKRFWIRAANIIALTILWWSGVSDQTGRAFLVGAILIGYAEVISVNVIFERDYYPLDLFADSLFPDKKSIGNRALYFGYYLLWMILTGYVLFLYKGTGSILSS